MYTEDEKKEINWGLIIKRGLIAIGIILVILLIIWLISGIKNNNNNKPVDNDTNKIQEVENGSLETYSDKFINNIRYMQEVAKNYWTVGGEIPTDGNSIQLTLKELIERGLILPFTDKDGKSCDVTDSYVKLTNNNNKYTMSIKLSCNTEVATINEEIGCNQLCNNACEPEKKPSTPTVSKNTKTQYEHKQAYTDVVTNYSCPNGYTLDGTKCYKSEVIAATKTANTNCPSGYKYNKNTKLCETTVNSNKVINANKRRYYRCPSDYNMMGEGANSYCLKKDTESIKATLTYKCEDNSYKLNGTICTKTITDSSKLIKTGSTTTYKCPSGYKQSGSGANTKCTKTSTQEGKKYFTTFQSNLGSKCKYLGRKAKDNCTTNCNKLYYTYYCTSSVTTTANPIKTTTAGSYSCSSGYTLSNSTCITTSTKNAKATYTCPSSKYKLDGTKCYKSTTDRIDATRKTKYSCPSGYDLKGSKCYPKATTKTVKPTITYTYTCKEGYRKNGSGASSKCIKNTKNYISANKYTSNVTKYKYTWSDSKALNGWTATGKTRKVNA